MLKPTGLPWLLNCEHCWFASYFIEINSRYTNVTTINQLKHLSCSYITGNNRVCITSRIALALHSHGTVIST